ncbi:GntR family transcriptional regulator [Sporolactobacillus pectinivorans]|uniref:GntR family transcriptional regulator n=1 Tax=Sporolactobacillus pectinivorans TaxID=1591408 RepID=UPI000C2606CD|nr:GntR family transcriptional regulator [Sporolactobacillus pectinivorans]
MAESFNTSAPIYLQLCERIKNKIIRGEISSGERLPSVRDLAIDSGVNPNTVQRTYRELEDTGVVEKRRGQGTFVTDDQEILQQMRDELKEKHISGFVREMNEMGYTKAEMLEGLQAYFVKKEEKQ